MISEERMATLENVIYEGLTKENIAEKINRDKQLQKGKKKTLLMAVSFYMDFALNYLDPTECVEVMKALKNRLDRTMCNYS